MKSSLGLKIFLFIFIALILASCIDCSDDKKYFRGELYPAYRVTLYDWEKVSYVTGDKIYIGIGTEYTKCGASGQEELCAYPIEFYTDREIIVGYDTIASNVNLLTDKIMASYMFFFKDTIAFFNSPQYLILLDNKSLELKDYYTFYFKGYTVSGEEIADSTIVFVQ
jgi:hypothetical protein